MPRFPLCTRGMNAKQRYGRRLRLQAALARVARVLAAHHKDGIPADRTTALVAAEVAQLLLWFASKAGVIDPRNPLRSSDGQEAASRCKHVDDVRKKETQKRYRRCLKKWVQGAPGEEHPKPTTKEIKALLKDMEDNGLAQHPDVRSLHARLKAELGKRGAKD